MDIIYLLLPIAIIIVGIAVWGFVWAVKSGQYDDLDVHANSILYDDDEHLIPEESRPPKEKTATQSPQKANEGHADPADDAKA